MQGSTTDVIAAGWLMELGAKVTEWTRQRPKRQEG